MTDTRQVAMYLIKEMFDLALDRRARIIEIARLAADDAEVLATSPHVAVICRPAE